MKKIFKILLYVIVLSILLCSIFIAVVAIKDYEPEEITVIEDNKSSVALSDSLQFSVISWNTGYCGLGADMDFFYDGGQQVFTSEENVKKNLKAVKEFVNQYKDSTDYFIFQEVDKDSRRSYYINEVEKIEKELNNYKHYFGKNYDVIFVPMPLKKPYGKAVSGLLSSTRFNPKNVTRHSFPGNYSFPMGLFMLDRCFLVARFKISNGKELLIINTHNSAYDDGSLRERQMKYISKFLIDEYEKGNYIVVGGDWNQCALGIEPKISGYIFDTKDYLKIAEEYFPEGWKWVYSNEVPTNRRLYEPWNQKTTSTTIIDFFLISPNVESVSIKGIDLNFKNSDHNPVWGKFKLINNNDQSSE